MSVHVILLDLTNLIILDEKCKVKLLIIYCNFEIYKAKRLTLLYKFIVFIPSW
jgi:hypothetical protein